MSDETKKPMPEFKFVGVDPEKATDTKWKDLDVDGKMECMRACLIDMNSKMIGMAKVIRDLVADKQAIEMERKILSARGVKLPSSTKEIHGRRG